MPKVYTLFGLRDGFHLKSKMNLIDAALLIGRAILYKISTCSHGAVYDPLSSVFPDDAVL
jgi:hypothetical protein